MRQASEAGRAGGPDSAGMELENLEARIRQAPDRVDLLVDKGGLLARLGRVEEAQAAWRQALALDPAHPPAHMALIQSLYEQGRWDAYEAEVARCEVLRPGAPFLTYERGYLDLLRGHMAEGWQRWEARLEVPGFIPPGKQFPQPRWQGEPFPGRTLMVVFEQGFGDTLMLARYLPRVKALGGRVHFLVQPQMAYLLTTLRGVDEIVPFGEPVPPFDLQVSTFSLPALFGTTLETVPADIPYLDVPPAVPSKAALVQALAPSEGRVRVGLAWGGNPAHPRDAQRSIPAHRLDPLGDLEGVAWHSFQLGREDRPQLPGLVDLQPFLRTFTDTAYALSGMDLLITVDTALAHLAGALGVPTLLLISYAPDPRWMLDREDTPWYPATRLYRQPRPGDWEAVIQRLLTELRG